MQKKKKVLLAGETWLSTASHYKGFDRFDSATFHSGAGPLIEALADSEFDLTHMPAHVAVEAFPSSLEALRSYDAVLLSDIGANTLLLHPDVWLRGTPVANRLKLIRDWTAGGGGLVMIGGYLSFQGIDGRARWRHTPVEQALPVNCHPYDDRLEVPEGFRAEVVAPDHPLLADAGDLAGEWPLLLGANEVVAKQGDGVTVVARLPAEHGGHPLLVAGPYEAGRSVAWTSDVGPHWLPQRFVDWPGYKVLWLSILRWVTRLS